VADQVPTDRVIDIGLTARQVTGTLNPYQRIHRVDALAHQAVEIRHHGLLGMLCERETLFPKELIIREVERWEIDFEGIDLVVADQALHRVSDVRLSDLRARVNPKSAQAGIKGRFAVHVLQQVVRIGALKDIGAGMALHRRHPQAHGIALLMDPLDQPRQIGEAPGIRHPIAQLSVLRPAVINADAAEAVAVALPRLDHLHDLLLRDGFVEKAPGVDFGEFETEVGHSITLSFFLGSQASRACL
jgi:hypothetical protein